ncbi:TIGR01777 family oxidoreductase [Desulfobacula toluolica]|uniref:NAD-dependent epimerase/dehydratase n=1 Tax=Desulfobacula toluolica (strain DSM 7467 / Tol2) TaxID=651182 RepID=K0NJ40_DESTT|nr:TIGR01777 family oxidoreductase [Desulfobacula toluolica]CCK79888.1 NAD-dependent epimerase/dehydratase [Desulfobacula toluolica Tol2]
MKKILITGASGFIGKRVARLFLSKGYFVTGLGTSKAHLFSRKSQRFEHRFEWVSADTTIEGKWQDHVAGSDIIINLAGRNIFRYWTKKYKQAIYDSRILTTRNIVNAIEPGKTHTLLTTSAVGIYGDRKEDVLTEKTEPGRGFLSDVCKDWEKEGLKARQKGVRVSVMRLGVVLGNEGALSLMTPAFKLFAGGPLGDGRQWFPWIHIKDLEKAVEFIVENSDIEGTFNFTGPTPVRQKHFAKALGRVLHRPAVIPAPAFMVRVVMGQLGKAFLQSQRAVPKHLAEVGYPFLFADVYTALNDILGK